MNLEQVVEFSLLEDSPNTIFMVLWSKIDFKGYDYFNHNREMNLHFLNDFAYFTTYCRQKDSYGGKCNTFDIEYCVCKVKKMRKNSYQNDINLSNLKQDQRQHKKSPERLEFKKLNIVATIQNYHNSIRDDDLIEIIRKGLYQSYYFRHRFSQSVEEGQYKKSNYTYKQVKDYLLQDGKWKIGSNGNFIFTNQQAIKAQKGVIKMVLKQIGSNILAGKSIMNMSLPVEVFDNVSMLEILANRLGFLPRFINEAINTSNIV